jgi:hypothetical protein
MKDDGPDKQANSKLANFAGTPEALSKLEKKTAKVEVELIDKLK